MSDLRVRRREESDQHAVEAFLAERSALRVARLGRLEQALEHPAFVAEDDGALVGVLTFVLGERDGQRAGRGRRTAGSGCGCKRRGFRLTALHGGAVDESRARLKPEIPPIGDHGIDLRDELELDKVPGA